MTGTARPITIVGNPVLHTPCRPVVKFDDELALLADDMFASMYAAEGVGLAANQIGVALRIFVYDCPDADEVYQKGVVVNPTLDLPDPDDQVFDVGGEGCLSVPGPRAGLGRPNVATVHGFDLTGAPISVTGTGVLARCFQHETDHLNGILYIDHLPEEAREAVMDEFRALQKEQQDES
ncbi:peptide deformylase [Herbidospora cretacea]|uniref:peptide deformylase n=1 Tax=Herbidospora cretacea TaxID=28444 RepID=UPI0007733909|nr:peptide deformylase [Herbidospora cretacea]